jgi:Tetracyclin repressor-like, C-terminal domain
LRSRGQDSGGAEVWAHGLVGMVQCTAEWWLDHRTTARAALVDDLAALAWSGIAGIFLAGTGIVEGLTAPTAPAPSTR